MTWSSSVPTSPSAGDTFNYGGVTYTYRVDNGMGVWDAAKGSGGAGGKYSPGWSTSLGGVTVDNAATMTITHSLGTADVVVAIWVNSSASDTNAQNLGGGQHLTGSFVAYGGWITNLTSNTVTVQLGSGGYFDLSSSGLETPTTFASKYLKVVVIA